MGEDNEDKDIDGIKSHDDFEVLFCNRLAGSKIITSNSFKPIEKHETEEIKVNVPNMLAIATKSYESSRIDSILKAIHENNDQEKKTTGEFIEGIETMFTIMNTGMTKIQESLNNVLKILPQLKTTPGTT